MKIHVLVIAHPDDESMFFLPTIQALVVVARKQENSQVWLLCLTNGNYNGLGAIRSKELIEAGKFLGIDKTIVQDNPLMHDHPTRRWDKVVVASAIRAELAHQVEASFGSLPPPDLTLITFDKHGISGHINHIDTYLGVCHFMVQEQLMHKTQTQKISQNKQLTVREAWQLHSENNLVFKYLPMVSWWMLLVSFFVGMERNDPAFHNTRHTQVRVFRLHQPSLNWKAMATHHSQFVWYRRLFVVFSCYAYYNKLTLISRIDENKSRIQARKKDG
jgi:N-acetylglucosaminylphosphatidylinositol deacetylase